MLKRSKALPIASAFALVGAALLAGCDDHKAAEPDEIRLVRTVVAEPQSEGEPVSVTGHIRARTEKSLAFRIDGRMIARRVEVGQVVHLNDLVAELDPQPQIDAARSAKAALVAAQALLVEASNNMDRQRQLLKDGWTTQVHFDAVEATFRTANASVMAATAQLHTAEDRLGYSRLLADAAGVVTAKGAEPGEVVRAGQMIVTVAEEAGVDAVFDVPASLMRQMSPDVLVTVALTDDPNVRATGRVRETAPQADPTTQSFRVKVGLTAVPETMHLGATVIGRAAMRPAQGIELPATALTTADKGPAVWVVDPATQQVSLAPVQLQRHGAKTIVVADGLKGGELVVTAGVHALRPGQKVRTEGGAQ